VSENEIVRISSDIGSLVNLEEFNISQNGNNYIRYIYFDIVYTLEINYRSMLFTLFNEYYKILSYTH